MSDASADKTVFISYRRSVGRYLSRLLFNDLRTRGFDVFRDVDSIGAGEFEEIILNQIAARTHFIVLLTHGTLERCVESGDWLRREIELAIDLGRNIIPVMVDGFKFEDGEKYLVSDKLRKLKRYQVQPLYDEFYESAVDQLVERKLSKVFQVDLNPTPSQEKREVTDFVKDTVDLPAPTTDELNAEIYLIRAYAKYEQADYDGAMQELDLALQLNPDYAEVYYSRGIIQDAKQNFDAAISAYTQAIQLNPNHASAYNNRGIAHAQIGDLDRAISDLNTVMRIESPSAITYYLRALTRYQRADLDGAIHDYSEAIRLNPQFAEAFFLRGRIYGERGDFRVAIIDLDKCIEINPENAEYYFFRARANLRVDDNDKAISDIDKAIVLNHESAEFYVLRAYLRKKIGDLDGAVSDNTKAIRLSPDDIDAYYGRGTTYVEQGKLDEAISDFQKGLALDKNQRYGTLAEKRKLIRKLKQDLKKKNDLR